MTSLFAPLALGDIALPNRIMMAPLTRGRATKEAVPTPIMADYYAQRCRRDPTQSSRSSFLPSNARATLLPHDSRRRQ